jgi:hypothetical protein
MDTYSQVHWVRLGCCKSNLGYNRLWPRWSWTAAATKRGKKYLNIPFSLLKSPFLVKLEEGKPLGFPPPHSFCNKPTSFLMRFSLFERTPLHLEFFLDLYLTLKKQQQQWITFLRFTLNTERLLHHLNGQICEGLEIGFSKVRFASLHQPKPIVPILHHR